MIADQQQNKGEILGLFPSLLARRVWQDAHLYNDYMKELFYTLEKEYPSKNNLTEHYYTSYNIQMIKPLIEYNAMKPFVDFLSTCVQELNSFIGFNGEHNFKIRDMWFAINRKSSYHETHNHSPAIWSGVYYVQAQEDDAPLKFFSPSISNNHWASHVINEYTDFSTSEAVFKPTTGMLNIFPGYLNHSVGQQLADRERIAISFNII